MTDESWKDDYKKYKDLKPYQIRLLDEGAHSLSQAWLLNEMWSEWLKTKNDRNLKENIPKTSVSLDPWEETRAS